MASTEYPPPADAAFRRVKAASIASRLPDNGDDGFEVESTAAMSESVAATMSLSPGLGGAGFLAGVGTDRGVADDGADVEICNAGDVEIRGDVGVWWCNGTPPEGTDDGGGRGGFSVSV